MANPCAPSKALPDLDDLGAPLTPVAGDIPSPLERPTGCVFHPRCPIATDDCSAVTPELREVGTNHWAACIHSAGYGPYSR